MKDEIKKAIEDYTWNEIYNFCKTKKCDECPFTTIGGYCMTKFITKSLTILREWELETLLGHMQTKAEDEVKDIINMTIKEIKDFCAHHECGDCPWYDEDYNCKARKYTNAMPKYWGASVSQDKRISEEQQEKAPDKTL